MLDLLRGVLDVFKEKVDFGNPNRFRPAPRFFAPIGGAPQQTQLHQS
jgi:hypothetical protein